MSTSDLRKKIRQDILEAADAILRGVETVLNNYPNKKDFKRLENKVSHIDTELGFVKDDIKGIKADISLVPSRAEFEKVKKQVRDLRAN